MQKFLFLVVVFFIIPISVFIFQVKKTAKNISTASPCYDYYHMNGDKPLEYPIRQGAIKLVFPPKKDVAMVESSDDKQCLPRRIELSYAFENNQFVYNTKINGKYTNYPEKIKIVLEGLDDSTDVAEKGIDNEIARILDEKHYTPKLEMKNYPLWLYPNGGFYNSIPLKVKDYRYGVKGTTNPLTHQPYLIGCSFKIADNIVDSDSARNAVMNVREFSDTVYSCAGNYYFVDGNVRLYADIRIKKEAVKDLDKIYQQLDLKLKSYVVHP